MWIWSILLHTKSWWYQKKYIIFKRNNGCWIFQNPWKDYSATMFSHWNHHSRKAHNVRVGKKVVWNLVPSKHCWCLTTHTETVLRTELQNSGWLTLLLLPPAEQGWLWHGQFNKMNHPSLTLPERYDLHICPWGAPWFCQWNDCPLSAHWYCFIHALHFFLKLYLQCVSRGMNMFAVIWVTAYLKRLNYLLLFVLIFHCQLKLVSKA